jgi:hypothetical protein
VAERNQTPRRFVESRAQIHEQDIFEFSMTIRSNKCLVARAGGHTAAATHALGRRPGSTAAAAAAAAAATTAATAAANSTTTAAAASATAATAATTAAAPAAAWALPRTKSASQSSSAQRPLRAGAAYVLDVKTLDIADGQMIVDEINCFQCRQADRRAHSSGSCVERTHPLNRVP